MKRGRLKNGELSNSYNAIHLWLKYHFGVGLCCSNCGEIGKKTGRRWSLEYALKPGRKHVRRRENYDILCKSCHRKQDYAHSPQMQEHFKIGHLKRKAKGFEVKRDDSTGRFVPTGLWL